MTADPTTDAPEAVARPRVLVHVRISADANDWVDAQAKGLKAPRADLLRAMLAVAAAHPLEIKRRLESKAAAERMPS